VQLSDHFSFITENNDSSVRSTLAMARITAQLLLILWAALIALGSAFPEPCLDGHLDPMVAEWKALLSVANDGHHDAMAWDERVSWFQTARLEIPDAAAFSTMPGMLANTLSGPTRRLDCQPTSLQRKVGAATLLPLVTRAISFAKAVGASVSDPRTAAAAKIPPGGRLSVVVAGGGPAGLLTALVAETSGRCDAVHVVEKRRTFSRRIWFDLLPSEMGGRSVPLLAHWGVFNLTTGTIFNDDRSKTPDPVNEIATIQCNVLQRALLLVLEVSRDSSPPPPPGGSNDGLRIWRGWSATGFCRETDEGLRVVIERNKSKENKPNVSENERGAGRSSYTVADEKIPACNESKENEGNGAKKNGSITTSLAADVVFAADGRPSTMRASAGLAAEPQLHLHHGKTVTPDLTQLTAILHFNGTLTAAAPSPSELPTWTCPNYNDAVGPYDLSTKGGVVGITAAFKRMWWPYCEIQFLFSAEHAKDIEAAASPPTADDNDRDGTENGDGDDDGDGGDSFKHENSHHVLAKTLQSAFEVLRIPVVSRSRPDSSSSSSGSGECAEVLKCPF
jgi:hypothetical protein